MGLRARAKRVHEGAPLWSETCTSIAGGSCSSSESWMVEIKLQCIDHCRPSCGCEDPLHHSPAPNVCWNDARNHLHRWMHHSCASYALETALSSSTGLLLRDKQRTRLNRLKELAPVLLTWVAAAKLPLWQPCSGALDAKLLPLGLHPYLALWMS